MSAEDTEVSPVINTVEMDSDEFARFMVDFIGPLAAHVPTAFRNIFEQLTGLDEFPAFKTYLVTVEGSSTRAFYISLQNDTQAGYELDIASNYFRGTVSPDAMGLILTLYVFNSMMWSGEMPERTQRYLHNGFYLLRDLAANHPEAALIYGAID